MSKIDKYVQSIQNTLDSILTEVNGLSEKNIRWEPSNDEWSILQILNHVKEATSYWLSEMETVLSDPGSQWGRGLKDKARLEAVSNPEALDVNKVIESISNLKNEVRERLSQVSESRLTEENPHRNFEKFGNKPVSFIIEHFIDEHIEKHHSQIKRNLSKVRA